MPTNPYEPPQDTALEWASGTIIFPEIEEFAFIYRVRLDDGREVQAMIPRSKITPEKQPAVGDRVSLSVRQGLCLVYQWEPKT